MAAPLVQRVELDAASAQRQLALLERQLATLNNPINVPVDIDVDGTQRAERQMEGLRREVDKTGDEFTQLGRKADDSVDGVLRVGTRGASAFTSLRGSILGVGAAIAAIQGVRILGGFAADAIQSASNLEESLSKTNVVFEDLSGGIQDFAKDAPRALGLSTAAALEATSTFGNLFLALGLTREVAADLSPDIVQLASDLASFNNIDVNEAVEKLRSGLVGEVEPLRTLGVNLNAATVEAKAMALGFVDANGAVTEAGKVQARYALILEQTTTAQGDYARTADGVANTQRTLSAEWDNAKTVLGQALLPVYHQLLELLPGLITGVKDLAPAFVAVGEAVATAAEGSAGFLEGLLEAGRIIPTTVEGLVSLGGAAVSAFQAIGGILSLDFERAIAESGELAEGIGGLVESLQVSSLSGGFIDELRAGVDPAKALANALVELSAIDLSSDEFAAAAEAYARISGLDASRLEDVIRQFREQGEAAGVDAVQIQILTGALRELNLVPTPPQRPGSRGGDQRQVTLNREISESALERAAALTAAAREEAAAVRVLDQSVGSDIFADLQPIIEDGLTRIEFKAITQDFADRFAGDLTSSFTGAFADSEGELGDDARSFVDRFITSIEEAAEFEGGLARLRELGAGMLAEMLEAEGPEKAAGLLADFLANPEQITRAEDAARTQAQAAFQAEFDEFSSLISAADFSAIPVQPVIVPIEADLTAFLATLEGLPGVVDFSIQVPVVPTGGDGGGGDQRTGGDAGRSGPASVNVEQNFYTEPAPTTQTTRAAQEINSIVAGQRGAQ